jgi:DNA helicase-2/ATP-dependent DNA helicase PcrA
LFLQEGIPYKIFGAFKFFERKEIKDITAYIKYFNNPNDNISLKRILNIPNRKVGKTTLETLEEHAIMSGITLTEVLHQTQNDTFDIKITPLAKNGIKDFLSVVDSIKQSLPQNTPSKVIEQLIKKIKYRDYLIKEE